MYFVATAFLSAARTMCSYCIFLRCSTIASLTAGCVPPLLRVALECAPRIHSQSHLPLVAERSAPHSRERDRSFNARVNCERKSNHNAWARNQGAQPHVQSVSHAPLGARSLPLATHCLLTLCTELAAVLRIQLMSVHMSVQLHFGRCPPRLMSPALPPHCGAQAAFPASQRPSTRIATSPRLGCASSASGLWSRSPWRGARALPFLRRCHPDLTCLSLCRQVSRPVCGGITSIHKDTRRPRQAQPRGTPTSVLIAAKPHIALTENMSKSDACTEPRFSS